MTTGDKVTFLSNTPPQTELNGIIRYSEAAEKLNLFLIEVINPPMGFPKEVYRSKENVKNAKTTT